MRRLISAALLLLAACREQTSPGAATSASASAKAKSSSTVSKAAQPGASAAARVRTALIEALIERWRSAQSTGDLAAYEKLYAKEFVGIKRVGLQTFRFDRKRWLLDRKGMLVH